jgi:prepilin-type N-terminal cleavage/methylation domain-containing protein
MKSRRIHIRGFTLIEAITAIVVLAVAVPAMFWGIRDAQMRRVDPIQASKARWLAAERLEDIIADRHSSARGYSYVVAANYPTESAVAGFSGFSRSVTITEGGASLVAGSGTGYKTVTVSVTFRDGRNTSRTLALATVVTDYAP